MAGLARNRFHQELGIGGLFLFFGKNGKSELMLLHRSFLINALKKGVNYVTTYLFGWFSLMFICFFISVVSVQARDVVLQWNANRVGSRRLQGLLPGRFTATRSTGP
jgi:hypothetical protein